MGFHWNSTKKSTRILLKCHSKSSGKWTSFLVESQHCSNSLPLEQKNLIPCGIPVKCRQNSGHSAVLTSWITGGITVELDKNISEIPARFWWTSGRISKKSSPQNSTGKFGQISGGNQIEFRYHVNPVVFHRNSTGTPPEYHLNSAGLTSKETARIPADFQHKIHRKSTGIPVVLRRNSGHRILPDIPSGKPAGFRLKFRWHSGAFVSWEDVLHSLRI